MKISKKFITLLIVLFSVNSYSAEIIDIFPDVEKRVILSKNNINRISLSDDVIESFQANKGDLVITQNSKTKDLYLRVNSSSKKVTSLFLVTKKGFTYKLNIAPRYITSKTLILNNPNLHSIKKANKNDQYKQDVISLLTEFYNGKIPDNYQFKSKFRNKLKIKDLKIISRNSLIPVNHKQKGAKKYKIEKYLIINKSKKLKNLEEKDFQKEGFVAIMLDEKVLLPKKSTNLYIVKSVN